jgi:hypothetical protein
VLRQIRIVIVLNDAGIGKFDHRLGGVEEETVDILHDEIGGLADLAQCVFARDTEQLQPDPAHAAEIGIGRPGIAGKAHPRIEPRTREDADSPCLRHVVATLEPAVGDTVEFAEYGALRRWRIEPGVARLTDIDEHFGKPRRGIRRIVEAFRNRQFLVHRLSSPSMAVYYHDCGVKSQDNREDKVRFGASEYCRPRDSRRLPAGSITFPACRLRGAGGRGGATRDRGAR